MKRKGLAQIPVLIGLLLMAIAIPVATKLVQTNQENRGKATGLCPGTEVCRYVGDCGVAGYYTGTGTCPGGKCCGALIPTGTGNCTKGNVYCSNGIKYVCKADKSGYTSSNCASGACLNGTECKAVPTKVPTGTVGCTSGTCKYGISDCGTAGYLNGSGTCAGGKCCGGAVPTKTPTSIPCIKNGLCKTTGVPCCSGQNESVATSICASGKKCAAVPTPTLKVSNCIVDNIEIPNGEKRCIKFGSLYSRQFKCINGVASLVGYFSSGGCLFPISIPNCEQSTGRSNNCVCNNNIQCSSGYCNTLEARCFSAPTPTPGSGKANGTLCTLDSECLSGNCMKYEGQPKKCVAKQPGGAACNIDSNCISDFCTSVSIVNLSIRKCVPIPNGTRCLYDRDCVSDNCVGKPEDKKCQAKSGSGATCTQNSQCASGRCSGGICVPNPTPTVKVCRNDIDYNGDGVINSLDMIYCSLH